MNITIAGTGYVGLSNTILLAQHNRVTALDIVRAKIDLINDRKPPIEEVEIQRPLSGRSLNLYATLDKKQACRNSGFMVSETPADYDPGKNISMPVVSKW